MILVTVILILLAGGIIAWIAGKWSALATRIVSLVSIAVSLVLVISVAAGQTSAGDGWITEFRASWIPALNITFHLAADGLSLILLILTLFLGLLSVLISWNEIRSRVGFFHFNLLWILAGISGVFTGMDLFLFYFFWELMLVPMYFLIGIWGHENRTFASYKFFIYTQASGLLMFVAILVLYFIHGRNTGVYSFDYQELLGTPMGPVVSIVLMSGFLAAFLVKLPAVPLHNWLPDAHTEAPTAGSLILAGLMLKTGAYGLIRFAVPLFPGASVAFAPIGMILGVTGILYGAMLAFSQKDLKRLVAYTSVSHMGFILIGVYSFNMIAMQGVIIQIIAHAISTGALFVMAGQIQERIHTRDIEQMGGLWNRVPVLGAMGMVFAMASLGLPGLGNFVAEFLILTGTFKATILIACLASAGLIVATIYSLRIVQKVYLGKEITEWKIPDLSIREKIVYAALVIAIVYLGLFPQRIMNTAQPAAEKTLNTMEQMMPPRTGAVDAKMIK